MSPRKVFLNARFLAQSITGVQRYAVEVVKALDGLAGGAGAPMGLSFTLLGPRDARLDLPLRNLPFLRVGRFRGHLWEQVELPFHARGGLLVGLCNAGPLLAGSQIVTIHDAGVFAVPEAYAPAFRAWYRMLLPALGRRARRIITDSEFSRDELARRCRIDRSRIRVVPLGADHMLSVPSDPSVLRRCGIGGSPYILAVGSRNPAKNLRGLARAFDLLGDVDLDLVVAGGEFPRVFRDAPRFPSGRIRSTGAVSDPELRALYEGAAGLVHPSLYEGFGLPPLEAMSCGCPVIASRAASLPEVLGDAALYCDPHLPEDIARKVVMMIRDASLREDLVRRGLERARRFRWEDCARGILAVMEEPAPAGP